MVLLNNYFKHLYKGHCVDWILLKNRITSCVITSYCFFIKISAKYTENIHSYETKLRNFICIHFFPLVCLLIALLNWLPAWGCSTRWSKHCKLINAEYFFYNTEQEFEGIQQKFTFIWSPSCFTLGIGNAFPVPTLAHESALSTIRPFHII